MAKPFGGQEIKGSHGFILPNREFIALEEVDRMCVYTGSVYDNAEKLQNLIGPPAIEHCRVNPRAFKLLEDLLMAHPELLEQNPVIASYHEKCFALMRTAAGRSGRRIR